jgi:hypothetical protein
MTKLRLFTLLLTFCAATVQADEPAMGFYAGASAGRAVLHRERWSRSGIEAHDSASKAFVGYRVYPGLALEAAYADYGDIKEGTRLEGNVDAFSVAAVGLIQLRQWDLFGKVGLGRWDGTTANNAGQKVTDNDIDPLIGIGVQFRADRFAVRVESEAQLLSFAAGEHGRDGDWVNFISLGASWTF